MLAARRYIIYVTTHLSTIIYISMTARPWKLNQSFFRARSTGSGSSPLACHRYGPFFLFSYLSHTVPPISKWSEEIFITVFSLDIYLSQCALLFVIIILLFIIIRYYLFACESITDSEICFYIWVIKFNKI